MQFIFRIESQNYNPDLFLKNYSGDMIITTQVRAERNKAILRGSEAKKNRDFVLENYNGIQPSIYPAWDEGFWGACDGDNVRGWGGKPSANDPFERQRESEGN